MNRTLRAVVMAALAGTLGLTLAVVPTNFAPEQAHAAIAPGLPDPLNILPSVLTGSKGTLAPASWLDQLAVMVAKGAKSPAFWKAVDSVKAGVPNKAEADLVADAIKKFRLPAFKPAALLKGAGAAGLALTAADVGLWLGNGTLDVVGVDRDTGTLCTGTAGNDVATWWTSNFNHVDCAAFAQMTDEAIAAANSDISAGVGGGQVCGTGSRAGDCIRLIGEGYVGGGDHMYVFEVVGWTVSKGMMYHIVANAATTFTSATLDTAPNPTGTTLQKRCAELTVAANTRCLGVGNIAGPDPATRTIDRYRVDALSPTAEVSENQLDPERWLECRIKLTNGANLVAESMHFNEGSGFVPPVICPEIPTGAEIEEYSVWEVGGGQAHELVPATQTTPEYDAAKTTYPECMDGTCMLELLKSDVSCFTLPEACADWFTDPNKTETMTCRYGSHAVPLSECNVYAPTFKPDAKPTNTPYGDPATGQPLPSTPGAAAPGTVADPTSDRNCFPTGWGLLNPVEWVVKPVGCALEYAFVPRPSKVTELTGKADAAWRATTLAKTANTLGAVAPVLMGLSDGGCEGIAINLSGIAPDILDLGTYYFLPACPGDFFHPWAPGVKVFLFGSIALGGFISCKAQISRFVSNGDA